jgi:hypothetical protein
LSHCEDGKSKQQNSICGAHAAGPWNIRAKSAAKDSRFSLARKISLQARSRVRKTGNLERWRCRGI